MSSALSKSVASLRLSTSSPTPDGARVKAKKSPLTPVPWKGTPEQRERFQRLLDEREGLAKEDIQRSFCRHVVKTLARSMANTDDHAAYMAAAFSVRDRLIDQWNTTQLYHTSKDVKRVYYLSLEFLLGRSLDNALLNMSLAPKYREAIGDLGFRMEDIAPEEADAALGNGGLGRLAACFMDSLATLNYPAWGYGIRYTYGIFQQKIVDGYQTEYPDYWLSTGNPWEIERLDISYDVSFGGQMVVSGLDAEGRSQSVWQPAQHVVAVAYDCPIPAYDSTNCINIRLWSAKPKKEFDLAEFNDGNYEKAVEEQKMAENITAVLYPNDNHLRGKRLRLQQQYFFVCATLQDIIRRFKKSGRAWAELPNQVAIQLNDTHPTLGIPELQRILIDEEGLTWDEAWQLVTKVYSYTNHTVLPEALEKWSVPLLSELLPRHMEIIFQINLFFLQSVECRYPGDRERLRRMSIIEEGMPQYVRMAYLAVVGTHHVNGVAALHSELVKSDLFPEFVEFLGAERFLNVTNGVTPRRWLNQANPLLAALITKTLKSSAWTKDFALLGQLKLQADDPAFQREWMAIKQHNKGRLAQLIRRECGVEVSPDALFDVQCKRLHEYKRQLMNVFGVIHRYETLQKMTDAQLREVVPHVVVFSGKSAPGYYLAKLIIKLISNVSDIVNGDARTNEKLKLVFIPNYCVSVAETIIPASDISQHISTAGTEASGTSNMKFVINGGLILGTVDGANIEIGEEVGSDNIYLFGTLTPEVEDIRYDQRFHGVKPDPQMAVVLEHIRHGVYGPGMIFEPLLTSLSTDYYLLHKDFGAYVAMMDKVDADYKNKAVWARKSILAAAAMGKFSSDRSIQEYAEKIWHIKPLPVP